MSLRSAGKTDAAQLLKEAVDTTPTRATRIRKAWQKRSTVESYTPEEALSLFIETKLTKSQYMKIKTQARLKGANIYPNYQKLKAAKEQCYPQKEFIFISESVAEVKLQALLDRTASRLVQAQQSVIDSISKDIYELILIYKWGCDGSTGHNQYKQKLTAGVSDSDMFLTSLVPIQLHFAKEKATVVWQNSRPSSVRYCRPIKIQYKKETTSLSQEEVNYIEKPIEQLQPTVIELDNNRTVHITHRLFLTMIDGKICNALTSTSSAQICYVCGAKPTEMNCLNKIIKKTSDVTTYRFGLSTLHAWIRF